MPKKRAKNRVPRENRVPYPFHLRGTMGVSPSHLAPLPSLSVSTFDITERDAAAPTAIVDDVPASSRKRKHDSEDDWDIPEDTLKNLRQNSPPKDTDGWEMVGKKGKRAKKQKVSKEKNYPEFLVSPQKLKSKVRVTDLRDLCLWVLADGVASQWLLVRHRPEIRKMVVLMVPGLTMDMFTGDFFPDHPDPRKTPPGDSAEHYFPSKLETEKLPACLKGMAGTFTHVWPVQAPGDDRTGRIFSPVEGFLNSPLPKGAEGGSAQRKKARMKIEDLVMDLIELQEDAYPMHPSQCELSEEQKIQRKTEGWVSTSLVEQGKPKVFAIDCEMCETTFGSELTRITVLDWSGKQVYDSLVKPSNAITDYLTQFSGITKALLDPITTTLADVQRHLLSLFPVSAILIGHSLNSDLTALRLTHPHIIDTSCLYHHSKGKPYKPALKWLTLRYLKREIQNGGPLGHDSKEDAKAALDLVKMKLERGTDFGTVEAMTEPIFRRIKNGAVVDEGSMMQKWYAATARRVERVEGDEQAVEKSISCVNGDHVAAQPAVDFVWARLRTLERARGWNTDAPETDVSHASKSQIAEATATTVERIKRVYEALPKCTGFVVYSGTGDPLEMRRLVEMKKKFKEEFKTVKWDEVSVQWTDLEEQKMRKAVRECRGGVGFLVVK